MTEAEAKAIEFKWADMSDEQKVAALGHATSRLLAVEAELATSERAFAQFDQWLGEQADFFKHNPQVNQTYLDCAGMLMKTLRGVRHVAPPSPPVAPEVDPHGETCACSACGGDGYYKAPRLGDEPCPECKGKGVGAAVAPEPAQEDEDTDEEGDLTGELVSATVGKPAPDPRLAHALANPPGPRHARYVDEVAGLPFETEREALASVRLDGETYCLPTEPPEASKPRKPR
jgi:hypothetical protein